MQKLYDLARSAIPVSKLEDEDRLLMIPALLLRLTTITGWIIPEYEMGNILVDQFGKIICEQYAGLNDQEIEYAFRQYGLTVEDWGKEVNLSMIHKAMSPYLSLRAETSRWEEEHIKPELPPPPKDEEKFWEDWIAEVAKQIEDDPKFNIHLLPVTMYEHLVATGDINPPLEEKKATWKEAVEKRQAMIPAGTPEMARFLSMKEANANAKGSQGFDEEEKAVIQGIAKKLTLFDYLWNK